MNKYQIAVLALVLSLSMSAHGQTSTSTSTGTATATAGDVNVTVNPAGGTSSSTTQSAAAPTNTTQTVRNVPAMIAPALTTTLTETCMGSTSGGVAVAGFGASFGKTWTDDECVNRLNARELLTMGERSAAREVMCANPVVKRAFKRTGNPCWEDLESVPPKKVGAADRSIFNQKIEISSGN